jgi:hypothetical protein
VHVRDKLPASQVYKSIYAACIVYMWSVLEDKSVSGSIKAAPTELVARPTTHTVVALMSNNTCRVRWGLETWEIGHCFISRIQPFKCFFSGTKNVQCYALEHNLEPHYDHWLRVRYPDKVILLMAMLLSPLRARAVHMHNAIFSRRLGD